MYNCKNNVKLNDYQGVNRLLQRIINGVLQDEVSEEKAKVISTLCNTLLKSLEGDLNKEEQQARIEGIKANTNRTVESTGIDTAVEDRIEKLFDRIGSELDEVS